MNVGVDPCQAAEQFRDGVGAKPAAVTLEEGLAVPVGFFQKALLWLITPWQCSAQIVGECTTTSIGLIAGVRAVMAI